jgi:WD40 repeat protein
LQSIYPSLRLFEYQEHPNSIAISSDNRYVAVSFDVNYTDNFFGIGPTYPLTSHGRIRIWDIENGRLIATFRGHKKSTNTIAFSPDGKWLASAGKDSTISFWLIPTRNYTWLWLLGVGALAAFVYNQRAYLMNWFNRF